jgi:hypothetical protein
MAKPQTNRHWDAVAEQKRWRAALESARKMQGQLGGAFKPLQGFSLLCLAELDAGNCLMEADCFSSREAFLAAVKRLIAEPTTPSQPVPSLQAYTNSQKSWLELLVKQYECGT